MYIFMRYDLNFTSVYVLYIYVYVRTVYVVTGLPVVPKQNKMLHVLHVYCMRFRYMTVPDP